MPWQHLTMRIRLFPLAITRHLLDIYNLGWQLAVSC